MLEKKSIKGIQFNVWNPESIKNYSVLHVTLPVTYDQNLPTPGGLFDPKLGKEHLIVVSDRFSQAYAYDVKNRND